MVITCVPTPAVAKVGDTITWTANISGGATPYTSFIWSGTNIPSTPAPSDNPFTIQYSTVGQKSAQIEVTDSLSNTATCVPGTVQIKFDPKFEEV